MSAGIWDVYGGGISIKSPLAPIVDHPHDHTHQHQGLISHFTRRQPDPKDYPNHPDVDVRDVGSEYLIEIEVPGIKNVADLHVQQTSSSSLIVAGETRRPGSKSDEQSQETNGDGHPDPGVVDWRGIYHGPQKGDPFLLIGERRIGYFQRIFNLPVACEMEKLSAKLEAGLLCLRVPKNGREKMKGNGKVEIESI